MINNIFVDFDSTIISCEIMEVMAKVSLEGMNNKDYICKQIEQITNQGMCGEIGFAQSLNQRLELLPLNQSIIRKTIDYIKPTISNSFKRNVNTFLKYNFHIISGGFSNVIVPLMLELGISCDRIHANELFFDNEKYIGLDTFSLLAQDKGKVKFVSSMGLNGTSIIIGDGYTDYEIKQYGFADYFCYYSENVKREKVIPYGDFIINNFDELWKLEIF